MHQRITALVEELKKRDLYEPCVAVEYDTLDYALPEAMLNAKRAVQYLQAQPVYLTESNRYTGMFRWDKADIPADAFHRTGHRYFREAIKGLYNRYRDNLVVFEWQHSAPNYQYILENGVAGSLQKIERYKETYRNDDEKYNYLCAVETVCRGLLAWAKQCAAAHEAAAQSCADIERQKELLTLAEICRRVPEQPARHFYEGLQSILFCFQFLPDSVGTIDRALYPLYRADIENGVLTRNEAKELIAEFYLHLCNHTPAGNINVDRSAECHFAIGGYTETGEDGFTDLSRLMVEALLEIDTRRPAISLRWTKKTPFDVLKFMLDCERHDKNKRFAFVNDEPRIDALMNICGFDYRDAVRYTMVGCNEPSFPGAVWFGGETVNLVRSLTNTLYGRRDALINCKTFDEFFEVYREELAKDLRQMVEYSNAYNAIRAKDINVVSAFLLDGCIENAKGPFQYGCEKKVGGLNAMGVTCLIDSLSIVKQFVFDEKRVTMEHLLDVLQANWATDEDLHTEILKRGKFFGNNEELSDTMARRLTEELYEQTSHYRMCNGAAILLGTLAGYHPHHMKFGFLTDATPDGRYKGDGFMVGTGQNNGKDRKGLLPLMRSLSQMDPHGILCGATVCNMMIDAALMRNDEYFDKVCHMIEQYFKDGGLHVQLNYVTKEELMAAKEHPREYESLKVRVSGFSASFVQLPEEHQDEILMRTLKESGE